METLGTYIARHREEIGKSGRQAARDAGISNSYLSKIEHDITIPSPEVLNKIAKSIHVPYEVLMEKAKYLDSKTMEEILEEYLYIPPEALEGLNFEEREEAKKRALAEIREFTETVKRYRKR